MLRRTMFLNPGDRVARRGATLVVDRVSFAAPCRKRSGRVLVRWTNGVTELFGHETHVPVFESRSAGGAS